MRITLTVNDARREVEAHPLSRLLDVLRDDLRLTGCKEGCGEGECGACAIIMNGELVNACMIPAMQAAGAELVTIEGLGRDGLDPLQQAFIDTGAVQCGFCTPGMILAARVLLENNPKPSLLEIRTALSGNLCRCTGYAGIHAAVDKAVKNEYRPRPSGRGERAQPIFSVTERDSFFSPDSLDEALDILARHPDLTLLAGGTDIGPDMKSGRLKPAGAVDIFRLPELRAIVRAGDELRIGACATDTDLMVSALVRERLPALYEAAARSAAPAVQNRATIGGNLCTASGAADLPVALLALGASVRIVSRQGERLLPLPEFFKGYRQPDLRPGEVLAAIHIPLPPQGAAQVFYKRGSREALTLARVSIAMYVELDGGRITVCRAAAGSMSPVPARLPRLEAALIGRTVTPETVADAVRIARDELNPRKSPEYRKSIAGNLIRRFLEAVSS